MLAHLSQCSSLPIKVYLTMRNHVNRHHNTNRDISRYWLLIGVSSTQSPWILGRVVSNVLYTTFVHS